MKSSLETQLSDDLSRIVADQPFMPDIEAIGRRGRRLHRRSMAVRGVAGLGTAAGITAIALAVSTAQPGPAQAGPAQPGPAQPGTAQPRRMAAAPAPSVTAIQARTIAAVSTASSNSVLQAVVTTAAVVIRSTVDAPDQVWNVVYENSAGQKKSELAMRKDPAAAPGQFQAIAINYTTRTWGEMNLGGSSIPNPATDFLKVFKPSRSGRVRFVGTAVIDGQPAYVIDFTGLHDTRSTATDWISKATMLPIKSVSPGATVSYQWSGPGAVNPATVWPTVPAGFGPIDPILAQSRAKEGR
jgi:hypothetical protein